MILRTTIQYLKKEKPLGFLLLIGLAVRFFAAFLSKGYGMYDDHFLVIEAAHSWIEGTDYNNWLPWNQKDPQPQGHNFFYVGLHFLFFKLCGVIGLNNPHGKMLILRVLHAFYSLLIISLSYKITNKLADKKAAWQVGLIMALIWFLPNFSVRNLVEIVCIPPLMAAFWWLIKNDFSVNTSFSKPTWQGKKTAGVFLIAGLFGGLAMGIRYQCALFLFGIGIVLLVHRQIRGVFLFTLGTGVSFFITQIADLFIWQKPFAELMGYFQHNTTNHYNYITLPWYNYVLTITGLLIPPVSLLLVFGYLRSWKKYLLIFLPVALFLIFHSYYPNKQERFIAPALPFLIILGMIGWNSWVENSKFWLKRKKILRGFWIFFWVVNTIVLIPFSTFYSKRSSVEAMSYLYRQNNYSNFIIEVSQHNDLPHHLIPPQFYTGTVKKYYYITAKTPLDNLAKRVEGDILAPPSHLLFYEEKNLKTRIKEVKKYFPNLHHVQTVEPSWVDKILHWLNPRNRNERAFIYEINNL